MERLTEKRGKKNVIPMRGYEIPGQKAPQWSLERCSASEAFLSGDAIDRLAAYEDTGLEPLEIETLKTGTCLGCSVPELKEGQALHKELEEAYQQGRLLVLPCPMGSTIYMIVTKHQKAHEWFSFIKTTELMESNVFRVCRDYGKTVFLTKAEALAALEGGQSDGKE